MNFPVLSQGLLARIVGLSPCQENQITLRHCFFSYIGCLLISVLNLKFTYKAMQGLATQYLSDLLEPYSALRSLRSASKLLLNSPSFNLRTYGYKSFSVCAPRLWNSLPVYIKSSSSFEIFRKRLKTYLFALFSINFCHSSELNGS